jgi:hypothetical protein
VPAPAWFAQVQAIAGSLPVVATRRWTVGGQEIELVAASAASAAVALDGIASAAPGSGARPAAARWVAFDGSSATLPPPPFGVDDVLPRDGVRGFASGRFRLAWAIERHVLWGLDTRTGDGFLWMRDPQRCAPWDRSAPWRPHLAWWLDGHGAGLIHAAAVAPPDRPDAGALLIGPGGSGKSTLALACAAAGWTVTSDDYVAVHRDGARWQATAPYRLAKATTGSIDLLGLPASWLIEGHDHLGKSLIDLPDVLGSRGAAPIEPAVIVAPRIVTDPPTPARPLHPAAVTAALGPSTVLQTPGDAAATLRTVAELARSLPAWALEVDGDVARTGPAALRAQIDRAGVAR